MPFSFTQILGLAFIIYIAAYIHWTAETMHAQQAALADTTIPSVLIE